MNTPSIDVKDLLVTAGLGTYGTDLFVSKEPTKPDACVTIYDTSGMPPEAWFELDYPGIQVRIRGAVNGYIVAMAKAYSIKNALHGVYNTTQGGARYISIIATGEPECIGYDENERAIIVLNFNISRATA